MQKAEEKHHHGAEVLSKKLPTQEPLPEWNARFESVHNNSTVRYEYRNMPPGAKGTSQNRFRF